MASKGSGPHIHVPTPSRCAQRQPLSTFILEVETRNINIKWGEQKQQQSGYRQIMALQHIYTYNLHRVCTHWTDITCEGTRGTSTSCHFQ